MDLNFKRRLIVREAMSSPVVTVLENHSVVTAAEIMRNGKIGAMRCKGKLEKELSPAAAGLSRLSLFSRLARWDR